jgi:outer membrane protein
MSFKRIATAALLAAVAAAPAYAAAGDKIVRVRGIVVAPTETAGKVLPTFPTGSVSVNNSVTPEVDFTYFVSDSVAFELIAATTKHSASGTGAIAGVGKVASMWVLPPTLTLQYHFAPKDQISPYVGAGVNYTLFYNEKATPALNTAIGATKVSTKSSFGYTLQAGVDFPIGKNMVFNIDVKYIDIDTTVKLTTGALVNRVNVSLDPVVAGVGIGWKF